MSKKGQDDEKLVVQKDQVVDVDMDADDVDDCSSILAEHSKNYYTNFGNPLRNRTKTTFCDGCSHAHCIFCCDKPVVVPQVDEPCHCGTSTCLFRNPGLCGLRFPELVDQLNELKIKRNKEKKLNKYKLKALSKPKMVSKKLETPHFWSCGCRTHIVPRPDKGDATFTVKIDSKRVGRLLEYPAPPWNRFGQGSSNEMHYHHSREHYPKIVKLQKQVKKLRKKSKEHKSSSSSSSMSTSDSEDVKYHHKRNFGRPYGEGYGRFSYNRGGFRGRGYNRGMARPHTVCETEEEEETTRSSDIQNMDFCVTKDTKKKHKKINK